MPELPRRLVDNSRSRLPGEWNKIVGNFEELQGNGAFNLPPVDWQPRERRVILGAALHRDVDGGKVTAAPVRWGGDDDDWELDESAEDIDIYPDVDQCGYFFENQRIVVVQVTANGRYVPKRTGAYYCQGVAAEAIAKGAIGDVTVNDSTIEVYSPFGAIVSGKKVGAGWDDFQTIWIASATECS